MNNVGIPSPDAARHSAPQLSKLTKADFPKTGAVIAGTGKITPPAA